MSTVNPREEYERWLAKLHKADPLARELEEIRGNQAEIQDRFYQNIAFGTAGLRGIAGAGTNRMNVLTVGRATRGIADFILSWERKHVGALDRGVVIAYDGRYHSKEFAELAARILASCGMRVFIFPAMRATPELSYAVRAFDAICGINMTASHNPKEYNGYKVYWEGGAQISGEISRGMQEAIEKHDFFENFMGRKEGRLVTLGLEMDMAYEDYVMSLAQHEDDELDRKVSVVYTPLNGAGSIPLATIMKERGFRKFFIVPEQRNPDPEFTTVGYPNPEDPAAFRYAEEWGKKRHADVLIATDPDSDRMAIEIPGEDGEYHFLNGNQTGALLIAYMAEAMKKAGTLPEKACMIKSIVTGDFGRTICEDYGIRVFEALTGFKNICGRIPELEEKGLEYFFGYEESIGCAPGAEVRDKDGIAAGMLIAEMAAYLRKQGRTIRDYMEELYQKYGYFAERQVSIVLKGQEGHERILRMMDTIRSEHPAAFGPFTVADCVDYVHGWEDIPASDVLKFTMTDGSWFAMRPSGTEPKIKFYFYTRENSSEEAQTKCDTLKDAVAEQINRIQ